MRLRRIGIALLVALAFGSPGPQAAVTGIGAGAVPLPAPGGPPAGDISGLLAASDHPAKEQPGDWMHGQRTDTGTIAPRAYLRALTATRRIAAATAREAPEIAAPEWTHMGPVNFGGRVVDLAVDPTQRDTVFVATASGGVWKTTDGGVTFGREWPDRVTQAMGALAVAPDGTLYAGTGEANPGGGSIVYGGTGLYVSRDGGRRWKFAGLRTAGSFGRIVVDPTDPNRVFAAATGNLFRPGGERGLYLSTDSGRSWRRVLEGANPTTGAVDVAVHPSDPDVVLAAMWDHRRLRTHRIYAGPGSGLYRSTDGGRSWTKIAGVSASDPKETGRIGVSFAPSDPDRAYAVVANKLDGTAVGLFRSDDAGKTWSQAAGPTQLNQSTYGWWFGRVWVDPLNPDRVFVGAIEVNESITGGRSFVQQTNTLVGVVTGASHTGPAVHADQHAMAWDPSVPGRVYLGNDGGVYRSDANGTAGTWRLGAVQGWTQHYSVDVSEQDPQRIVSGLQDNMCQRNYLAGNVGRPDTWTKYGLCGDGLQTLIDPTDDRIVYGCAQYGANCSKTLDGGFAFLFLGDTVSQRRGWWVPVQFDPSDPNVLYYGGNVLNRSTDGGETWSAISPDLTTQPKQLDPNPGYRIYGTITTVAAARSDPNTIYVGTDDGLLWRTSDLGKTWNRLTDADLPSAWVTRVAVDPGNENRAYATFSGFRSGNNQAHVTMTTDGGKTWRDISRNLPPAPANEIVTMGQAVAVGTDVGVFVARPGGKWRALGRGLPAVPVLDLRYHEPTSTLTAATFGHGIQRVVVPEEIR